MAFAQTPEKGWHVDYLGVPYLWRGRAPDPGWDCWGMIRFCHDRHFGFLSPDRSDLYSARADALPRREKFKLQAQLLREYRGEWQKIEAPIMGAVLLLKVDDLPVHVGLSLGDRTFLHVTKTQSTHVATLGDGVWDLKKVEGIYVPR
ncbi:NlpC/P60 family protein [Hyphobacterium sp.]|uniref:NlpC/P60 family protein n=1 Tax=Hyphobacterium sp. TaxID=2004662 RepID=UPI003BAAE4A7